MATFSYDALKAELLHYVDLNASYGRLIEIGIILLLTSLLSLFAGLVLRLISKLMVHASSEWDDVFIRAAREPMKLIIWFVGLHYALDVLVDNKKQADFWRNATLLRDVGIAIVVAWGANRFIRAGEAQFIRNRRKRGKSFDLTTTNAIAKLLIITVNVCTFLIILQHFGISIDGVLAFGGISGIAVGFAAKDMLANFFGALIIYFDKPFKVGDWIRSPDQEIEGTVEHIGWRMTTIITFDKRPLYVPNSVFTTISVENPSRMSHRRLRFFVGLRYDDLPVMEAIIKDLNAMLAAHPDIDQTENHWARFDTYNTSSCDILVNCFTKKVEVADYQKVREDVLLKITDILADHGAEFAFPTQTQHIAHHVPKDLIEGTA